MRKLTLPLEKRSYNIYIEQNLLNHQSLVESYCIGSKVLILSNEIVAPLYLEKLKSSLSNKKIFEFIIPDGEDEKNINNYSLILDFLIDHEFRRNDTLIALGGGVIGDLGGFVAASYQRGMNLLQFPTTLLAQVDSSVGGKTAINHPKAKNMIGAFYQPRAVFIDTLSLKSLPDKEYYSGFAEVVKYAILGESKLLQLITEKLEAIHNREQSVLGEIIDLSCRKKSEIVTLDETETGNRALLNLGHTFAHGIEKVTDYKKYLHGEAVSIGIMMALNLSRLKSLVSHSYVKQCAILLKSLNLPLTVKQNLDIEQMIQAMKLDKKNINSAFRLVLPVGDRCVILQENETTLIKKAIELQLE